MKKSLFSLMLLVALSITAFADGEIPFGGKSCPNGQSSCLLTLPDSTDTKTEEPIYKRISDFLRFIFG